MKIHIHVAMPAEIAAGLGFAMNFDAALGFGASDEWTLLDVGFRMADAAVKGSVHRKGLGRRDVRRGRAMRWRGRARRSRGGATSAALLSRPDWCRQHQSGE